jgi:hypothetical protein
MKDPKWRTAMFEEMEALDKNNTWILGTLPPGKKLWVVNGYSL